MEVNVDKQDFIIISDVDSTNIGVHFVNENAFRDFITTPFLSIILPCGCSKTFQRQEDISYENIKCEHDNYFIKIGE